MTRSGAALLVLCGQAFWAAATTPVASGPLPRGVDSPVLQEPSVQDFYTFLRNYSEVPLKSFDAARAPQITRVTNLDDERFQQLVRDGVPFVVDDCTKGFDEDAISQFQCKDFADRWPSGNMRAEYSPGQYHIYLKDPTWYSKVEPRRSHEEHMAGEDPIAGPYIWHVKDEEPLQTKREVQKHWRTPYFLEKSLANRIEANESFEFWFSMAGGGTFTHADAYCESTISMQFRGTKRWRIQAFPEIRHYLNASSFGDEQIYGEQQHVSWMPETEFTVGPGQCFIFPTGYLHETFVDPKSNDAECYTASTFQFNHPRQVNLYRSFSSRFSMSHYGMSEPCLKNIESYATLMSKGRFEGKPDESRARAEAERLVKLMDRNGDGQLNKDELYGHFATGEKQRQELMERGRFRYSWFRQQTPEQQAELEEESMNVWSEDALQYHDLGRDKLVSVDELTYGLFHWNVIQYRASTMRSHAEIQSPKKWAKKALKAEQDMLAKFYCADPAACPALDELKRFADATLQSKPAMAALQSKVLRMMESEDEQSERHDETLTMMDRSTGAQDRLSTAELKREEL
mmetsp:Transcript_101091/g.182443  ORF Transcript_101091/g.182443 Transcript_101091/m.182443 type:complete len:572 (-) Transcript_101091:269-1984(-)